MRRIESACGIYLPALVKQCPKVLPLPTQQIQAYPGPDIPFSRFPQRRVHKHHPLALTQTEILHGKNV